VLPQIQFSKDYLLNVVAILGTTISPYLFFWQAQEVEDNWIESWVIKTFSSTALAPQASLPSTM